MPGTITTKYRRRISISTGDTSSGTWTRTSNSGNPYISRNAGAGTTKISFALPLEGRDGEIGNRLEGIDLPVRISAANLVSTPTFTVYRRNASLVVNAAGVNATTSTVAGTLTGATITQVGSDRLLSWVPTTPAFDYSKDTKADYVAELVLNCATTTSVRIYNGIVYFSIPQ